MVGQIKNLLFIDERNEIRPVEEVFAGDIWKLGPEDRSSGPFGMSGLMNEVISRPEIDLSADELMLRESGHTFLEFETAVVRFYSDFVSQSGKEISFFFRELSPTAVIVRTSSPVDILAVAFANYINVSLARDKTSYVPILVKLSKGHLDRLRFDFSMQHSLETFVSYGGPYGPTNVFLTSDVVTELEAMNAEMILGEEAWAFLKLISSNVSVGGFYQMFSRALPFVGGIIFDFTRIESWMREKVGLPPEIPFEVMDDVGVHQSLKVTDFELRAIDRLFPEAGDSAKISDTPRLITDAMRNLRVVRLKPSAVAKYVRDASDSSPFRWEIRRDIAEIVGDSLEGFDIVEQIANLRRDLEASAKPERRK